MDFDKIKTRPGASDGLWAFFLLPISVIVSFYSQPEVASAFYKLAVIFVFGLILSSFTITRSITYKQTLHVSSTLSIVLTCITSALFRICLHRGLLFSFGSGIFATIVYQKLYYFFMKRLPKSFSFGEGAICIQSYTIVLYFTGVNFVESLTNTPTSDMKISTLVIQLGIVALNIILSGAYAFKITNTKKFFIFVFVIVILFVLLPLAVLIKQNPVLWILDLIMDDLFRSKVTLSWGVCSILASLAVLRQVRGARRASTAGRKLFHVLSVNAFLIGLLFNCSMLYLASGVLFGLFFALEILRVGKVAPFDKYLLNATVLFIDEKDAGIIALTPIYLLAGCAMPIWVHPAPCDVTNASTFNLLPMLSGVLCIGVGDTAASVIGSRFGRFYWNDSKKTIEGTLAFIVFQILFILSLVFLNLLVVANDRNVIKTFLAIVATALIEAKSDQIDNLVLPFVMYIMLIL